MAFTLTDTATDTGTNSATSRDSGSPERVALKLMTAEYSTKSLGGAVKEPVVELFCRDETGTRHQIDVEGFYPYFWVPEAEFVTHKDDLLTDRKVRAITADEALLSQEERLNGAVNPVSEPPLESLLGDDLVKIETVVPGDVASLREVFDTTYEADVFFTTRFLIDTEITYGLEAPITDGRVSVDQLTPLDKEETPEIRPRMCTVDIEVWAADSFPDPTDPSEPVTAITAHDSQTGDYFSGVLHPSVVPEGTHHSWDEQDLDWQMPDGVASDSCDVRVYYSEAELLGGFNQFVIDTDPDLLSGWNSSSNDIGSGFDYPYLLNRCERINEYSFTDLPYDDGSVFVTDAGRANVGGREMFDMLQGYKKTQIHEKRSYSLDFIADEELGYGKEDIDGLNEGWLHHPVEFMRYNIRDVEAVHEIESEKSVIDIYDHVRSITGTSYGEIASSNIGLIDELFLREARSRGYALPTSERPDVQYYWGAYVFEPQAGRHENVVYPDLSSLYPNLFRDMNASPETIIGTEADLRDSQYTKEQCHKLFIDPRAESAKRSADVPEREALYVLKPEVKESFVREIVQDLIDMKYEYKKDEYADEAYGAVKRIVNSTYGVMGDSNTYGTGFRLFDWRIAEAITLAGRDVIKHTASEFANRVQSLGYGEAEIIAGDTDSCVCTIPEADGSYTNSSLTPADAEAMVAEDESLDENISAETALHETLLVSQQAAEYVDQTYDEFMKDRFNIADNNMAVEIESYAVSALFMNKKKRYAQLVRWDEGDIVDEIEVKGFELVRSDSAEITSRVQHGVIDRILTPRDSTNSSHKQAVGDYLEGEWSLLQDGDVDLSALARPAAINNPLFDYGWSIDDDTDEVKYFTPQPHIRGARYAKAHIDGEDPSEGSKPLFLYVDDVAATSDYPETYDYDDQYSLNAPQSKADANRREMKEIGREVDAIAVEDVARLPEAVQIDYEKMGTKTLRDPIEPITDVMGWDFDTLIDDGEQTGLASFM